MLTKLIQLIRQWKKRLERNQGGFTLVEMLVAVVVFVAATVVFMQVFIAISRAVIRTENMRAAQQDVRFAMEQAAREIRQAKSERNNSCDWGYCYAVGDGGQSLTYKNSEGEQQNIKWVGSGDDKYLEKDGERLTSKLVEVKSVQFDVITPANEYPIVEMVAVVKKAGYDKSTSLAKEVTLRTRVTSRLNEVMEGFVD